MRFGQAKEISFVCTYQEVEKEKNPEIQTKVQIASETFRGVRANSVNT